VLPEHRHFAAMKPLVGSLFYFSLSLGCALEKPIFAPKSMAYVLQADRLASSREAVVQQLAACDRDLIVIDAAFNGAGDWTPAEIETIRAGKNGRRVVAYVSIGEAEDYREIINAIGVEDLFVAGKKLRSEKQSRYVLNLLENSNPVVSQCW